MKKARKLSKRDSQQDVIDMKWKLKKNNSKFNIEIKSIGPQKNNNKKGIHIKQEEEEIHLEYQKKEDDIMKNATPTLLITFTGKKPKEFESKATMLFRTVHYKIKIKMNNVLVEKLKKKNPKTSYACIVDGQYFNELGEWETYKPDGKLGILSKKEEEDHTMRSIVSFSKVKAMSDKSAYEYDFRFVVSIVGYSEGDVSSLYVLESSHFRTLSKPGVYANQLQKNTVSEVKQPEWTEGAEGNVAYSQSLPNYDTQTGRRSIGSPIPSSKQPQPQQPQQVEGMDYNVFSTPEFGDYNRPYALKSPDFAEEDEEDDFPRSRKWEPYTHAMESPPSKKLKENNNIPTPTLFTPPIDDPKINEDIQSVDPSRFF